LFSGEHGESERQRKESGERNLTAAPSKQVDLDALRRKIVNYVGAKALPLVKTATAEAVKVGICNR